ncbi:MAG: NAD(+)/NADH kinase [Gemmatimonadota bacterium]|jgi:NAD+ kinase|nr:MAG: NAD(+)/NADH kinase [Gemmatimonadota bacterium]
MRLGVLGNPGYAGLPDLLARLSRVAGPHGIEVFLHHELAAAAGGVAYAGDLETAWPEVECVLTLGGDGTLLRAARLAGPAGVPILGCNVGRLGFLTSIPLDELETAVERVARGEYELDERLTLEVTLQRKAAGGDREKPNAFYALNDAVVHKSGFARLVQLRVWADEEELGQYSADGIIISTATGSTAYSLSAGGPILVPALDAIVATPICPHTMAVRPVVLPANAQITVEIDSDAREPEERDIVLTVDGQVGSDLGDGDRVIARRSTDPVRLIRFPGQTFFSVLRRKLRWGDVRPPDVGGDAGDDR